MLDQLDFRPRVFSASISFRDFVKNEDLVALAKSNVEHLHGQWEPVTIGQGKSAGENRYNGEGASPREKDLSRPLPPMPLPSKKKAVIKAIALFVFRRRENPTSVLTKQPRGNPAGYWSNMFHLEATPPAARPAPTEQGEHRSRAGLVRPAR